MLLTQGQKCDGEGGDWRQDCDLGLGYSLPFLRQLRQHRMEEATKCGVAPSVCRDCPAQSWGVRGVGRAAAVGGSGGVSELQAVCMSHCLGHNKLTLQSGLGVKRSLVDRGKECGWVMDQWASANDGAP